MSEEYPHTESRIQQHLEALKELNLQFLVLGSIYYLAITKIGTHEEIESLNELKLYIKQICSQMHLVNSAILNEPNNYLNEPDDRDLTG